MSSAVQSQDGLRETRRSPGGMGGPATTIDKVQRLGRPVAGQRMPDSGQLIVEGDTIEFRGKKGTIRMTGVRDVAVSGGAVAIVYGEPSAVEKFMDRRRKVVTQKSTQALAQELRSLLGLAAPAPPTGEIARAQATAAMKAGRRQMLIAGLFLVAGVLVTWITFAQASSGGGRYFVAWGAMLWGAVYFCVGLVQYLKGSRAFHEAGDSAPSR